MTLGPNSLVLCSGTVPRDISFLERLEAGADAGYEAISLWGRDYARARRDGHSDAEMRAMLDDHGLVVAEVDPAWWWTPGAGEIHIPVELDTMEVFIHGEDDLLRMAEAMGARSLNAADVFGGTWTVDEAAKAFARLCDRAAQHGLLVHLEWLAWSRIPDMATAWAVVHGADRANGGLNIDTWHCARTGTTPDELRTLPPERVFAIQLSDAPLEAEHNLIEATLHDRSLPGEGALDLPGYLGALRDSGVRCPVGAEVFSDALHDRGARGAAAAAADATRRALDAAQWARP
ncbi:MAG TPA: sugar phosphate isomerase/epimerase family protein [Acidimicrobiales bacterium]